MPSASTFDKVSPSHPRNVHLRNATLFIDGAATESRLGASESRSVGIGGCELYRGNLRGGGGLRASGGAFEFYDSHLPARRSVWRLPRDRTASATRLMAGAFLIKRLLN